MSLQPVFTAALVASLGAFCFGFHLAVLNGPLAAIAAELGFAGQPVLEGMVRRPVRQSLLFLNLICSICMLMTAQPGWRHL